MDTIWHTVQANALQAAFAAFFLLLGLYGLRPRNWPRQKRKLLNEHDVSAAEVEALFQPTRDPVYNGLQRTGSAVAAIGGVVALYLLVFVGKAAASTALFACLAVVLTSGGAIYAFKLKTMRDIARLYRIANRRVGAVGDLAPPARWSVVNGYARYHGIILLIMGLGIGYAVLRPFVPVLPDLKWPG